MAGWLGGFRGVRAVVLLVKGSFRAGSVGNGWMDLHVLVSAVGRYWVENSRVRMVLMTE